MGLTPCRLRGDRSGTGWARHGKADAPFNTVCAGKRSSQFLLLLCRGASLNVTRAAQPMLPPPLLRVEHAPACHYHGVQVLLCRGAILNGAREAQLMMLSGFALEMLEAAGRAPLDSRTAIGRAITQASWVCSWVAVLPWLEYQAVWGRAPLRFWLWLLRASGLRHVGVARPACKAASASSVGAFRPACKPPSQQFLIPARPTSLCRC